MKLTIAAARSRKEKLWKNIEMTWEEFLRKVGTTIRTVETVEQYKKLPKDKQDDIKDVGGFVGGRLREGRRRNGHVEFRSMLTLDMDYAEADVWEHISKVIHFACCIYSTHKHSPQKPRLRLIVPLRRKVSADEYTAAARKLAEDIGLEQFDDTTFEPARLMYWPSTSADGQFIFKKQGGAFADPDKLLVRYKNWKDSSEWPLSSRQKEIVRKSIEKQADPLSKDSIIGAFCRAYSIHDAIEKFLPGVYRPSLLSDRYDYIPADSTAGLIIYDERFAYSHHATDPACGRLCSAFDLVRLHRFGHLDASAGIPGSNVTAGKLPSFTAMQELCIADDGVKRQLAKERLQRAEEDFAVPAAMFAPTTPGVAEDAHGSSDLDWQAALELGKNGDILNTLSNIMEIVRHDPKLKGISYNSHRNGIDVKGELPWEQVKPGWNDSDSASANGYFDKAYRIWAPVKVRDAILSVASERKYHPVRDYLEALPQWDKVERLDTLLVEYLGAEDSSYTRAVTRKTLCAAVARIFQPGRKFDHILVLYGPQGIGKSTFFDRLAGRWFSDSLTISDMRDKAAAEKLQGYWILELGELAGIKKMDVETVKSFISRTDDKYRASYGYNVESHPRQCIIVGTTNSENGFLRDITGNRRFWPVKVGGGSAKKAWHIVDTDQIWAEALVKYREGEELFLKDEDASAAFEEQKEALEADDREGLVREYLKRLLPENWRDMDLGQRRGFLYGGDFGPSKTEKGTARRERVCTMEIWCECFGREASTMKRIDTFELNSIMAKIEGWQKYEGNKSGRYRFSIYGVQNAYSFTGEENKSEG